MACADPADAHVSIDENLSLMAILNGYIEGTARDEVTWAEEIRRSGLTETEWMARSSPHVHQLLESGQYPIFTKIAIRVTSIGSCGRVRSTTSWANPFGR
ncbi:hypothetical protein [Streptosporangium sp. NBC_01469]|uniref:hypothetical protein n=1 Tax=Streptosporangium sp. NBC_01469 TaxID=2903898 RepID=UPI002E2BBD94|nr:hypothetical protein [Streptosporangium sp. NBC_01469]